jgi:hypothetical protein
MDCLITKLKGTVNDDTLMKIGEIRIVKTKATGWDTATQNFAIKFNKDVELEIVGDGYFTDKTGSSNLGKTKKITANTETGVYVSNSDFEISIPDKYALTKLKLHYQSADGWSKYPETKYVKGGLSAFIYSTNLEELGLNTILNLGDISPIKNLTKLTKIDFEGSSVTGDISALQNLTALTDISLSGTQVSGDISALSGLTALTNISLYSTQVTGNLDSLANLPSGLTFDMGKNTLTGDYFKFLNEHTNSDVVCSGNFSYTTKSWSGKSYRRAGGDDFTCNDLDNFLNDFQVVSLSSTNRYVSPSIKMKGTRTSASDAAISVLQGKGFTVNVPAVTDSNSISLMSEVPNENFGIAYKDKELIVELVDLSKMQIYPADGVTVKTFATKEGAEKYIKNNVLIRS